MVHTLLFSLHRSDLRSLAFQRDLLRPFGITPARYLVLLIVSTVGWQLGKKTRWMFQSDIRRELGVSAVTVSKMLRAMERERLVTRTRERSNDKRQVLVQLTRKAFRILRRIETHVIRPGAVWTAIYTALGITGEKVGTLHYWLDQFRERFNDAAEFLYPWCDRTIDASLDMDGERDAIT